jgi:AraC-like DNA-binding protein
MAIIPLQSELVVAQHGRSRAVRPGEFVFMDSAAPFEMDWSEGFQNLYVHFPSCSFVPSLFYKAVCRAGEATTEFDLLFKSAVQSIWNNAGDLRPTEHGAALNSILSLCPLTSAFRDSSREIEPCIRVTRAMNFIEDNLGEDWLSPMSVAEAQGVSRRYLDDRFGLLGLRIERWIWERRLLRARDELGLSGRAGRNAKTIIQVALDNGFKSPSHFSRSFAARFGASPREFRKAIEEQSKLH